MTITSNPNAPIFYVYALLDPRKPGKFKYGEFEFTYEPFYIGKGKGDRTSSHKVRSNALVKNKLAKIERELGRPHLVNYILTNVPEPRAYEVEELAVSTVGRKNQKKGPLLNLVNGGQGKQQLYGSRESLRRRAESVKEHWAGLTKTEYEERIRSMKVPKSDAAKAKLSDVRTKYYEGDAGAARRKELSLKQRKVAALRTPEETAAIYSKQRRTRELNQWIRAVFG